eukprot:augustus_masked-scaffold_64-processed-gene-0.13-mRNA-1 protein AED:1.00 eAED:1.00 QI:0/0/0/0/1/1/4/0/1152
MNQDPPLTRSKGGISARRAVTSEISQQNVLIHDSNQIEEPDIEVEDIVEREEAPQTPPTPSRIGTADLQLQMSTLMKSLESRIPLGNNKMIKRNLFKKKQKKKKSRMASDEGSESGDSSESSSSSSSESESSDAEEGRLRESEKNRAREEKYKGKPILRSLDPGKVSVFLEEFEVYEENVVKGRLRLPNADIVLCVSNNVQVMLKEERVNLMSRKKVIKYLTKIRKLQNKGKEKVLMRKVEALTWTNEGTPMKSMGKFLKEVTEMTRGVKWETRSMEKEFCCKVIKSFLLNLVPETLRRPRVSRNGNLPALKLLTGEVNAKKPKSGIKREEKPSSKSSGLKGEEGGLEKVQTSTLDNGAIRHHIPRSWSKEKRKQCGIDHNLCLFCYTTNHSFDNCELVKKRDAERKKTVNEMEVSKPESVGDDKEDEDQSDGEESVFVGVIEVLDVEEDEISEGEDGEVGSMNPVDLGEMLVDEEFEVGRDVGKPHVSDPKVQKYLRDTIKKKVQQSLEEQVIDEKQAKELESILVKHVDAFGSKIAKCDFNSLTPMKIELKEGVTEYVSKPYPMSKVNMEALKSKLRELEDMGMIRREPNPFFSSPVIMVPKPGKKDEFRMVVDLRRCNRSVKATGAGLPDLETQLAWFSGSEKYFGSFDGLSGFDYLRIEEGAEKYLGMVTPWGCYTMLMAPQGYVNTPQIYQERVINEVLGGVSESSLFGNGVLQWIDDSLLYTSTWEEYKNTLGNFLSRCINKNFRLNLDKCDPICKHVAWCGRIISDCSWRYDDKYFVKLSNIGLVRKMGQLEDLVHVSTWLSSSVPHLAKRRYYLSEKMKDLEKKLKDKYKKKMNRHQRRAASIEEWWENNDQREVTKFLDSISVCAQQSLKLYQKEKKIALFTDASFQFCGEFVGSSIHWSMMDKELYPIIKLMKRYRFILFGHLLPINLYTDHKNLTYLMTPKKDMKTATFGRVQRWILTMQEFDVVIHHLSGEQNVLADLLTRWGYVESKDTVELKEKLVDHNEDAGWTICWKGITFFANSRDVNVEKRNIRNMIQTSDREELLEIQEEGGKGWRFDPETVEFVNNRVAVHFPKRKNKYQMVTLKEINEIQDKFVKEWKDMNLRKNDKGSWVDSVGRVVLPQLMVERFIVTAHNASGAWKRR